MECDSKSDASNNMGNWNHLKVIQTVPEQHNRKEQNQGTTKAGHTGHCTHTAESANVKELNTFNKLSNITCNHRTAATLCTLET